MPLALQLLTNAIYDLQPETYDRIAPLLMGLFPFTMMFLVTSIAVLRERTSGTLERLMASPLGKGDLIAGYAITFTRAGAGAGGAGGRAHVRPARRAEPRLAAAGGAR